MTKGRIFFIQLLACAQVTVAATSMANVSEPSDSTAQKVPATGESLGGEAALSRNLALYENGQYEACITGLKEMLAPTNETKVLRPELKDQAETYLGACLIASGRLAEADEVFAGAIRNNPQMRAPDNLIFPQTVVDRFLHVREQLWTVIRKDEGDRVKAAEQRAQQQDERRKREILVAQQLRVLAANETVVEKNRRWLATVPFGVGQFQNGDNAAGWIFLGLEAALMGTTVTAMLIEEHLANRARDPGIDPTELSARRRDAYRVIVVSSWSLGLIVAGGIAHAHWRFVPEHHYVRTRTLPQVLGPTVPRDPAGVLSSQRYAPLEFSILSVPEGAGVGIVGKF